MENEKINFWKWLFGIQHIIVAVFLLFFIGYGVYDYIVSTSGKGVAIGIIASFMAIFTMYCFQIRKHWREINSKENS